MPAVVNVADVFFEALVPLAEKVTAAGRRAGRGPSVAQIGFAAAVAVRAEDGKTCRAASYRAWRCGRRGGDGRRGIGYRD